MALLVVIPSSLTWHFLLVKLGHNNLLFTPNYSSAWLLQ